LAGGKCLERLAAMKNRACRLAPALSIQGAGGTILLGFTRNFALRQTVFQRPSPA
jgi:hypothetical protein